MSAFKNFNVTKRTSESAGASVRSKKQRRLFEDEEVLTDSEQNESNPSDANFSDSDFENEGVHPLDKDFDQDDRDWVLEPDQWVFENEDEDTIEDDLAIPGNGIDKERSLRTKFPGRLLMHLDERCGDPDFTILVSSRERARRIRRFDDRIRRIVRRLKLHATTSAEFCPENLKISGAYTRGFKTLLTRSDEDFLVESVLSGVPESTKLLLGKEGFTIDDLLSLPRLSDSELSEQSLYIDIVAYGPGEEFVWRLYVGSGTGQFGSMQRWYTYLIKVSRKGRHEAAIYKAGRTSNLRCIAHYGFDPESWLTILGEGVMMIYLGTVNDPRLRQPGYPESVFVNDRLYEEIDQIRSDCELEAPLALGLNSTWTLAQGWRDPGVKSGAKCINCQRVVPEKKDPLYNRAAWRYADPVRPKADHLICANCSAYLAANGRARPLRFENKRTVHSRQGKPKQRSGRKPPKQCEYNDCSRGVYRHYTAHLKYYCTTHFSRAKNGINMDKAVFVYKPTIRSKREKPSSCEAEGCEAKTALTFHGPSDTYYCKAHLHRASAGKSMVPQRIRSTREKPDKCEAENCDRDAHSYYGAHGKYYCTGHHSRAHAGRDMARPITFKSANGQSARGQ